MLRYKCFSSMMTGNAIMFGRAIANPGSAFDEGPFYYIVIMFAFASGAVLQRVSEHFFPNRGGHILSLANHLSNLMLTGSLAAQDTWKAIMAVMILDPRHVWQTLPVGTLAGAILGAFMVAMVNLKVLLMPVPVVLYILLWMHDHLAKPRSIIKKAAVESKKPEQETSSSDGESSDGAGNIWQAIDVQVIEFICQVPAVHVALPEENVDESEKVEPLLAKLWSPKVSVTKAGKLQHGYLQACQSVSIEGDIDSI
eukprot:s1301_g7.t1